MIRPCLRILEAPGQAAKPRQLRGSILYDVLNDLVMDAHLEPMKVGEQAQAWMHINHLCELGSFEAGRELVIFDRGYPSRDLIQGLIEREIHYLMRVRAKFSLEADALGLGDHRIELEHGKRRISVRVIKLLLPSGEIETLLTSLTEEKYGVADFKELYFKRWPIETKYDVLKKKLEIENFSGRLVDNIRQDFYAAMVLTNLAADFFHEAQMEVDAEQVHKNNKYLYKVNMNHEIGVLKDLLIKTLIEDDDKKRGIMFDNIISLLKKRLIPIRPNRSLVRAAYPRKAKFHHNHKSNC
jgi:hypothetical protein